MRFSQKCTPLAEFTFSPVHIAVNNNDVETLKLLLSKGANPHLRSHNGQTPADLARELNDTVAVSLLT